LQAAIRANGVQVLARLDHAAGPYEQGASLDATTFVVSENRERRAAALVKALRLMALDLPFRALVWQDAGGKNWIHATTFAGLPSAMGPLARTRGCSRTWA